MTRVLLVDDSTYQRIKIRKFLEAAGYEVIEGGDGEEGLRLVASSKPDCMLLDLLMPKIGGIEVLQDLREKQLTLPVIIHTSDIQEETRQECLALGAVAFLNKPSREEDILALIAQAMRHPLSKESGNATTA
jgi:CheY-like chemotaxis protein